MRKSKIPTLLAIFILIAVIAFVLYAKSQIQFIKSSAQTDATPQGVKITNIKDTSFSVNWLTDSPTIGYVEYTNQNGQTSRTAPTINEDQHLVTVENLNPVASYSFKIISNGQGFDNSNSPWGIETKGSQTENSGNIISGQVLTIDHLPAKNALVFVDAQSETYSTQVTASGNWILALPSQLSSDTILNILVEDSTSSIASAKINLSAANPVPQIMLGNSYDFTTQDINKSLDVPTVPIQLP